MSQPDFLSSSKTGGEASMLPHKSSDYVTMAAAAMAEWARANEPLRLSPRTFRQLAAVALEATTLLSTRSVASYPAAEDES